MVSEQAIGFFSFLHSLNYIIIIMHREWNEIHFIFQVHAINCFNDQYLQVISASRPFHAGIPFESDGNTRHNFKSLKKYRKMWWMTQINGTTQVYVCEWGCSQLWRTTGWNGIRIYIVQSNSTVDAKSTLKMSPQPSSIKQTLYQIVEQFQEYYGI